MRTIARYPERFDTSDGWVVFFSREQNMKKKHKQGSQCVQSVLFVSGRRTHHGSPSKPMPSNPRPPFSRRLTRWNRAASLSENVLDPRGLLTRLVFAHCV